MGRIDEGLWARRREVLAELEKSGLSAAEFCRREGIAYQALMAWRRRIRELDGIDDPSPASGERTGSPFAELVVKESSAAGGSTPAVEIALPSGAVVRVYKDADPGTLAMALREARSC